MSDAALLSATIFLPTLGALLLLAFDKAADEAMKVFSLLVTGITFILTLAIWGRFDPSIAEMQMNVNYVWIGGWNINYQLGVDGISLPLILLTSLISMLSMAASWNINRHVRGYLMLFLILETGMMGVFLALDFFLFYVFWEVMLLPMYFLIGIWGGPRKEYAAIKFFLYTLLGSVLMLVAILMLYFASDLGELVRRGIPLEPFHLRPAVIEEVQNAVAQNGEQAPRFHTFNLLALAAMGQ